MITTSLSLGSVVVSAAVSAGSTVRCGAAASRCVSHAAPTTRAAASSQRFIGIPLCDGPPPERAAGWLWRGRKTGAARCGASATWHVWRRRNYEADQLYGGLDDVVRTRRRVVTTLASAPDGTPRATSCASAFP